MKNVVLLSRLLGAKFLPLAKHYRAAINLDLRILARNRGHEDSWLKSSLLQQLDLINLGNRHIGPN